MADARLRTSAAKYASAELRAATEAEAAAYASYEAAQVEWVNAVKALRGALMMAKSIRASVAGDDRG